MVTYGGIKLRMEYRDSVIAEERLNDMVINVAQRLLKKPISKNVRLVLYIVTREKETHCIQTKHGANHAFTWQSLDHSNICKC